MIGLFGELYSTLGTTCQLCSFILKSTTKWSLFWTSISDSTAKCSANLTIGSEGKTMFNGYVLEPLVLLVEVK